jgi:hypothetical protein
MKLKLVYFLISFCGFFNLNATPQYPNFVYYFDENNYKSVMTSINSILQNYDGIDDELSFYLIYPGKYYLDVSTFRDKIDSLIPDKRFSSWRLLCTPIEKEVAEYSMGSDLFDTVKCFLGEIYLNMDKLIWVSSNTMIIRNIKPLWEDYPLDDRYFLSSIGNYRVVNELVVSEETRSFIGCMVANLKLMRDHNFAQQIQEIISAGSDTLSLSIDSGFLQFVGNESDPTLPIRFDAMATSLPSAAQLELLPVWLGAPSAEGKKEELLNLTLINFADINPTEADQLDLFESWIGEEFRRYYIHDASFPKARECCDYKCCPADCKCHSKGERSCCKKDVLHFGKISQEVHYTLLPSHRQKKGKRKQPTTPISQCNIY